MSDIAIRVENLSKQYRIGGKQDRYKTFRDSLSEAFIAPFRRARNLLRGQASGAAELSETIWALKDISFEVHHGEVVGIIGRNGAGKTTLLKILSRITEPTRGCADIYGRVGSLLEVGTGFHPELTGRENITLNGAILGMKRQEIKRKFDEIVAFAEIEKFIDTPVKHYSSGMYVRLAFSVAAHLEPEILLVDEVLAVGDAAFQTKCIGKMENVASEGRTVLFVSHNMSAVSELCKRGIYLENGEVNFIGDVKDAISNYISSTRIKDNVHISISASHGYGVEFGEVELVGALEDEIRYDEPTSFAVDFIALNEISDMRINCIVEDHRRRKVFHLQTTFKQIGYGIIAPGSYRLKVQLPTMWLSGGVYQVVFKFMDLGNPYFDKKIESNYVSFSVVGIMTKFDTVISPKPVWDLQDVPSLETKIR